MEITFQVHISKPVGRVQRQEPKKALTHQVEKEFPSSAVVEHKKQLIPGLEGHVEPNDEGVLDVSQHIPLGLRVLYLISLNDVVLPQDLHRVDVSRHLLSNQKHLSIS